MYKEVFALRLYARRKELDLSQVTVSTETEINQSNISKFEAGKLEPNLETLGKLANYYEVSIDWLLGNPHNKNEGDVIKAAILEFYNEIEETIIEAEKQKFSQDEERNNILDELVKTRDRLLKRYQYKEGGIE